MKPSSTVAAAAIGLAVSALVPIVVKPLLARWRALDVPVERSSHVRPVLRGGGVAPAVGMIAGTSFLLATSTPGASARVPLTVIGGAAAATATLGLAEDLFGVPLRVRAAAQVTVGALASSCLVRVESAPWWLVPLGTLAVSGYINVTNFMDGINGISSLHGLVAGIGLSAAGAHADLSWLSGTGASIAGAFLSFLPWNIAGSGLFLGDVGSYVLGGAVSVTSVAAVAAGVPFVRIVAPLLPYLTDSAVTLMRRIVTGEAWYEAHRSHVYQVLALRFGHIPIAVFVTGASSLTAVAGIWASSTGKLVPLGFAGMVLVPVTYLSAPRIAALILPSVVSCSA